MEGINHKNIVRFHGCFDNEHVKGEKFIIMEYCPGGTLNEEIRAKGKLPENVCLEYFKQIVDGMVSVNSDCKCLITKPSSTEILNQPTLFSQIVEC